jgi:hypothetical protein
MRQSALRLAAAGAFALIQQPAFSLDTMESIVAEKCGRAAKAYDIEFLAPDNATLEAKVEGRGQRRPRYPFGIGNPVARWQGLHGRAMRVRGQERADLSPLSEDQPD